MTKVLYMEPRRGQEPDPCYIQEFDARVLERGPDFVVLDQTAFYAEGGGQPWDTGMLRWDGGEAHVHKVTKEKGVIRHFVDAMPDRSDVQGLVDWDRRYAHMRYHTSQHLMSGIVWKLFGAHTVGNQLYTDRARIDFQPASFTLEDLRRVEDECNRAVTEGVAVQIFEEDRAKVENTIGDRSLLDLIPKHIVHLRVVQVGDRDYVPCGGTHLKNTSEIGYIRIVERRSKGKETDRITYVLEAPQ